MVLSNKKLKQRLRATLAESLAESVAAGTGPSSNHPTKPDPNPQPQSLKELLDSAAPKPRLSKREKRRKNLPLQGSENANTNVNGDISEEKEGVGDLEDKEEEKKKEKKRKRDEPSIEVEDGVVKPVQKPKKKKKKKTKKNKKKAKIEEKNKGVEPENGGIAEQLETQTVDTSQSLPKGDVPTKVYVGGIPFYSTEDDIRSYFESCGTMTEVDCMRFPESGKFRGIAIISFKTEAAAKRALALDGADMGGLFLKIQPYKTVRPTTKTSNFAPELVAGYNRIYVGNLSWDISEDDLRKFFSDFKISSIRLGVNKETGEFKGYAHVDFSDSLSVTMALKLDQKILCGRPVKISCAVPRKEGTTPSISTLTEKEAIKEADEEEAIKEADDESGMGLNSVSGKIRRRTCYVCGEKGHLSSDCLATKRGITPSVPVYKEVEMEAYEETLQEVDAGISGKIRRRTCYECGEKGHLSSACPAPKKGVITPSVPVYKEAEMEAYEETLQEVDAGVSSVSGKIRRRTCYECGEKGHLSSACPAPKKGVIIPSVPKDFNMEADEETPKEVYTEVTAVNGKMRRRTCYECGEKGHLSSDCTGPKKGEIT